MIENKWKRNTTLTVCQNFITFIKDTWRDNRQADNTNYINQKQWLNEVENKLNCKMWKIFF